jgi:FMN reductase
MSDLVTIGGSPSHPSRSSAILGEARAFAASHGLSTEAIHVRELNAEELLYAQFDGQSVSKARLKVEKARALVIATPVYKAAYTGILKAFLDVLPQGALTDKIVFPIATGGSPAHLLAIDYALKPVLSALGAQHILNGLYIQDAQIQLNENGIQLQPEVQQRLTASLQVLVNHLIKPEFAPLFGK